MEFDPNRPIYLQINDSICERILEGVLSPEDRIPSVREWAAEIGVNPNTVARSYEKLTDSGIIYNKRGIGYFVCPGAKESVREIAKKRFLETELPNFLKRMNLLGIDIEEIIKK